jgi:hypothetical protein
MAYLIYYDGESIHRAVNSGKINISLEVKNHPYLRRKGRNENIFLVDYEIGKLYGPVTPSDKRIQEEETSTADRTMRIDCSRLYRLGIPLRELGIGVKKGQYFINRDTENQILEKLKFHNGETIPIIINLSLSGNQVTATIIEIDGGSAIRSYAVEMKDSFFSLIRSKMSSGEELLHRRRDGDFTRCLEDIGNLIYDQVLHGLNLQMLFCKGGYTINIAGDEKLLEIPFEISHHESFIFENNILTYRGKNENPIPGVKIERTLIIADPSERYEWAYREGIMLRDFFKSNNIGVDLLSRPLQREMLIEIFHKYDIVHFAGHSVTRNSIPGWDIGPSVFTAQDLVVQKKLPFLVFSSACGNTIGMGLEFLRKGIRNCVVSRWRIPDVDISRFIHSFYFQLLRPKEIGYSFNRSVVNRFRSGDILPLTFVLLGEGRNLYENKNTRH